MDHETRRQLGEINARANRERAERLIASIKGGAGLAPEMLSEPPMSPEEARTASASPGSPA